MEAFITVEELSQVLKVTQVWLYKLVRQKRIPFYHVEKCIRFKESEIEQWLQQRKDKAWHRDKN